MSKIDFASLTPALFAIAIANHVDHGVAGNMVQQNIEDGRPTNHGAEELPASFRPDWARLGGHEALLESNDMFNAWIRTRQANRGALAALWRAEDYQGMIDLMRSAADPGPMNPDLREQWEKEKAGQVPEGDA